MIETCTREVQKEAEMLYKEMSGGNTVSLKVTVSTQIEVAGIHAKSKTLFVHPDFFFPKYQTKRLFPENSSNICSVLLRENETMLPRVKKAMLAHEVAHLYLNHTHSSTYQRIGIFLLPPFGLLLIPYFGALSFFATLTAVYVVTQALLERIWKFTERHREHQADLKAVQTTRDPEAMCYFLKKASLFIKGFSLSHPHPLDRIRYLEKHYAR